MRVRLFLAGFLATIAGAPLNAEEPREQSTAAPAEPENCVEVRIDGAATKDFTCVNAGMKSAIKNSRDTGQIDTSLGVSSPSSALGTFNIAAEKLKMGENFGKSVVPFRPPPLPPRPALGPAAPGPKQK